MVKKANVGPSLSKMSQSWGKCPWLMPTSAREAFCTASQNWSSRRYSSNIHICLSRCWDDDCSPDASLFGICFCAFHGSFRLQRKTDIVSHSMTCTALCWEDGRGEGAKCGSDHAGARDFCGLLHTGTVLLCRWLNRFAYLAGVVLCSHCIIVQRVKVFIVLDGLLGHFGHFGAAS